MLSNLVNPRIETINVEFDQNDVPYLDIKFIVSYNMDVRFLNIKTSLSEECIDNIKDIIEESIRKIKSYTPIPK